MPEHIARPEYIGFNPETQVQLKILKFNSQAWNLIFKVHIRVTLKTFYTAYADDVTAYTKVSVIPIPTTLVIRNWDVVWDKINVLKTSISEDLKQSQTAPTDQSYFTSFSL